MSFFRKRKRLDVKPERCHCTHCGKKMHANRQSRYDAKTGDEIEATYRYVCLNGFCPARGLY